MEAGFYRPELGAAVPLESSATVTTNWRQALPVLTSGRVTLRELELRDAPSLHAMLTTEEVSRFISPPPTTVEGFELFIKWTLEQRAAGQFICFAVVPAGLSVAIGLFQLRSLEVGFTTAEWGFALASPFWGTGLFVEGARLVLDFAFRSVGIRRMEARASVENGRGNGALQKLGAVQEGVLRRSFVRYGRYHDQALWSILGSEWGHARSVVNAGPLLDFGARGRIH